MKQFLRFVFAGLIACSAAADDFDILRQRWIGNNAAEHDVTDESAQKLLDMQKPDGSFSNINYADEESGRWDLRRHWQQLDRMAEAYRNGGRLRGSKALKAGIIRGIEHWSEKGYVNSNWWYQWIGIPLLSTRVLMVMYDELPPETLAKFRPILDRSRIATIDGKFQPTATNLLHLAAIQFQKGVLYRDEALLLEARKAILDEIAVAPKSREGVQADWSFHQHGAMMQFGNYGLAFLETGVQWAAWMDGTKFAFPKEKIEILYDFFFSGMRWVIFRDRFDFSACGRQIAGDAGKEKADSVRRIVLQSMIFPNAGAKAETREWYARDNELSGNRMFYRSDYMVHRRRDLFVSVKMCSSRVSGSESTNHENELGRHTGGGVTLFERDATEYEKLMPLWNWRRLPGLTAAQDDSCLRSPDDYRYNRSPLAGGVSDGRNGATALQLDTDELCADKSVMAFDHAILCRTSDVKPKSKAPILTTVDSVRCRGPVAVYSAAGRELLSGPGTRVFDGVERIEHDGMAYRFPESARITVEIADRSSDWAQIQPSFPKRRESGRVLTLWGGPDISWIAEAAPGDGESIAAAAYRNVHYGFDSKRKLGFALFFDAGNIPDFAGMGPLAASRDCAVMWSDGKCHIADVAQSGKPLVLELNGRRLIFSLPAGDRTGESTIAALPAENGQRETTIKQDFSK